MGWGVFEKKSFHGRGMDNSLNYTKELNRFWTLDTSQGLKLTCQLTGPLVRDVLDVTGQKNFCSSS